MSLFPRIRTARVLLTIGILVLAVTEALAAGAPMSASQLALYQGADREAILIQGAKKEGQLVSITRIPGSSRSPRSSRRSTRSLKSRNGAPTART
jgi:hypothetical protein